HEARVETVDFAANRVTFTGGPPAAQMRDGHLRWIDGPQAGLSMVVTAADETGLVLDISIDPGLAPGTRALLREGCDHTLQSCAQRFANAVNFRGEPFLPGNDLVARYPMRRS
ncbi:MAG TPA: phage BR0599 family protein, partial [Geminicoccaceae bacterium]|nr:phage BR0599 family protein [Geminicoccaceae bacterium]